MEILWIALAVVLVLGTSFFVYRKQITHKKSEQIETAQVKVLDSELVGKDRDQRPVAVETEAVDSELPSTEAKEIAAETSEPIEPEATLKSALSKTRSSFWGRISSVFGSKKIDDEILEEIEEVLYTSDLGPKTVQRLMEAINAEAGDMESIKQALKDEMISIFDDVDPDSNSTNLLDHLRFSESGTTVWMIVGVNGAGKTTSIGKIAAQLSSQGKSVMIVAGDTFRAAAVEQLEVWAERAGAKFYSNPDVTDPSAIAFQGCERAIAEKVDVILIDTAGRLHTQSNLMEELKKMKRVVDKKVTGSPHEVLIVLDSNSGQNALIQAREFNAALGLTGVVLTKLDGTAKGGVAVGVACELSLPVKLVGIGEKIHDLKGFSSKEFVDSIF